MALFPVLFLLNLRNAFLELQINTCAQTDKARSAFSIRAILLQQQNIPGNIQRKMQIAWLT